MNFEYRIARVREQEGILEVVYSSEGLKNITKRVEVSSEDDYDAIHERIVRQAPIKAWERQVAPPAVEHAAVMAMFEGKPCCGNSEEHKAALDKHLESVPGIPRKPREV